MLTSAQQHAHNGNASILISSRFKCLHVHNFCLVHQHPKTMLFVHLHCGSHMSLNFKPSCPHQENGPCSTLSSLTVVKCLFNPLYHTSRLFVHLFNSTWKKGHSFIFLYQNSIMFSSNKQNMMCAYVVPTNFNQQANIAPSTHQSICSFKLHRVCQLTSNHMLHLLVFISPKYRGYRLVGLNLFT